MMAGEWIVGRRTRLGSWKTRTLVELREKIRAAIGKRLGLELWRLFKEMNLGVLGSMRVMRFYMESGVMNL